METVYFYCAVLGGGLLVLQTLLLLVGGDADAPDLELDLPDGDAVDPVAAHDGFLKVLSFKAMVAFVTFFGLVGLGGTAAGWSGTLTTVVAIGAGIAAIWLVGWLMATLAGLQSSGTVDLHNALGSTGTVYLRIPGGGDGNGRVTLTVQGRRIECRATTAGPELRTGAPIRVVRVHGNAVEVEAAPA